MSYADTEALELLLMWSEIVSVINLQTLKLMLKSAQFKKISGDGATLSPLCLINLPPLTNTSGSATVINILK